MNHRLTNAARIISLGVGAITLASLAGCSGHGKYTQEGISLAQQRLNTLKAATERDMAKQAFLAGDLEKAMRKTDAALGLAEENASLYVLRGRIHIERGNMGEALLALKRATELDPKSVDAAYYLGVVHERLDEQETALARFRDAAALDPYNPQHVVASGEMLIDLGRTDEARAELLSSESAGHSAGVQQLLGHIALIDGNHSEACNRFEKARLLAPDELSILEDLVSAQLASGLFAGAESNLRALLQRDGNESRRDLRRMLAECLMSTGRPVDAREIYRDLIRSEETDQTAWVGLGRAAYALSDERELRRAASRAISLDPKSPGGYVLYAVWSRDQGEPTEALARLDSGLMRAGPNAELLSLRSLVLSELGRDGEALASARAAVDLDPTHTAAWALVNSLSGVTSVPVD